MILTGDTSTTPSNGFDWQSFLQDGLSWIITTGIKVVIGVAALLILFKILNSIARGLRKRMEKKHVDHTITIILTNLIRKGGKVLVVLAFVSYVGIDTAGITALIASLGVGIGLALQGSLSNLAGGLVLLMMRPFRIGDFITAQGCSGTVEDIGLFYTVVVAPDNKVQMIPNGNLANDVIVNISLKDTRRLEIIFSVAYESDIEKAKQAIFSVLETNEKVLKLPNPMVKISNFSNSSIDLTMRVWVKKEDFWDVHYEVYQNVKIAFDASAIEIPFPQMDVHLKGQIKESKK